MFWYVARPNEIFIDTDHVSRSIKHTCKRLLGAIKCARLNVVKIESHNSTSEDHVHMIISLGERMGQVERAVWALVLHSDIYRAACTIMRSLDGVPAPDILITPHRFDRAPDDVCNCVWKHDAVTMQKCPAAIKLRGDDRVKGFFGLPDNDAESLDDVRAHLAEFYFG